MEFKNPPFFILLLLLPVLFYFSAKRGKAAIRFSETAPLRAAYWSLRLMLYKLLPFLRGLILVLFILALARPQKVTSEKEQLTKGVDIILTLDISGSMMAEDFKPENRMGVAKQEASKFIRGRENDRIGLVVFARKAFTQVPLTLDYDVLLRLLDEVQIGMIPDGTAIGMGLATAVNRLRDSDAKSKVIILIGDGANNAGNIDPITAAELAKTFGIKVYSVLVGRGGLVPFPVNDPLFGKRYVQAEVEIDEMTMKRIADITNGLFFRARDPKALEEVYQRIDELEKTEVKVQEYRNYEEIFPIFLVPALLLLLAELLLAQTVLLKVP